MKNRNANYVFFALLFTVGVLMRICTTHHYAAGILTGIGAFMLPVTYIGWRVADAAGKRIDKNTRDIILNQ